MIIWIFNNVKKRIKEKMILEKQKKQDIENRANKILKDNNLLIHGFDLIKFLTEKEKFEISLQDMPRGTTGLVLVNEEGNILGADAQKLISINSRLQSDPDFIQKSRFIVAHEYAHSILHKQGGMVFAHRSTSMSKTKMEQEADFFARCLLMPLDLMEPFLKNIDFQQLNTENKINYLSKVFNVTTKKAEERLKDIQNNE